MALISTQTWLRVEHEILRDAFVGRMKCILSELFVVGFKPLGDTDDNF